MNAPPYNGKWAPERRARRGKITYNEKRVIMTFINGANNALYDVKFVKLKIARKRL
jgi:hypothetical protein